MKIDLIIAGVGGQGILAISAILCRAALAQGLHVKQSEVHGMAQRGGAVQSHLRLHAAPIHSDLIPLGRAAMILALEPLEALRYLPWLAPDGWVVSNDQPVGNIPDYPPLAEVHAAVRALPQHFLLDAQTVARAHGSARAQNMAMLGAASPFLPLPEAALAAAIAAQFAGKGQEVVAGNLAVFHAARDLAKYQ